MIHGCLGIKEGSTAQGRSKRPCLGRHPRLAPKSRAHLNMRTPPKHFHDAWRA